MIVLLFTDTYPYDGGAEQTFLVDEVKILAEKFDKVVLAPRRREGNLLAVPPNVDVDESYAAFLNQNRALALKMALLSPYVYKDLAQRPSILFNVDALRRLIKFVGNARLTQSWIDAWFIRTGISPSATIFYTYWFDDTTFGLGLATLQRPQCCLVSRAHGYDLYEERYKFPYWPCRRQAIALLDRLFPDSFAGAAYLSEKYNGLAHKVETSLLGVNNFGGVSPASTDGVLRIVSCSRIVPIKRVDLIMEGLAYAAQHRSDIQFAWTHFGDGSPRGSMQVAASMLPHNATAHFPGYDSQAALLRYYQHNPVDVFVNVSISEGTPVAVMEAVSCGIPVLATDVGGNKEIVTTQNGMLLPPNPSINDVASALIAVFDQRADMPMKREASLRRWREYYHADANFSRFAETLKALRIQKA